MTKLYSIGVDTGGTYTDAVIVDLSTNDIVATAKSLTTHGELSTGVSNSLHKVLTSANEIKPSQIARVCLSTTLATNALVEGRGSSLAVVLIGFDQAMIERTQISSAIPEAYIISVEGGHKYDGSEYHALDEEALIKKISSVQEHVDAFAIASHYSVRNPSHERHAQHLIKKLTEKPVSASCDLSDSLDGPKRALTAAFNARIISLIVGLKQAVEISLKRLQVDAPIMIVKGDGSIADAESVMDKPIETILSGPAASVIGARMLSGKENFIVSDIGGTTTDIATVEGGWPATSPSGAWVGGFRTLVKAIDLQTMGLGGDSEVELNESSEVVVHNHRVIPISMLAHRWPHIEDKLSAALSADSGMRSALQYLVVNRHDDIHTDKKLSPKDLKFLNSLDQEQPNKIQDVVSGAADRSCVKRLVERGLLRPSGYTPSDAAHVLGLQNQWSAKGANAATELLGRASYRVSGKHIDAQLKTLAQEIFDSVVKKSTHLVVEQLSKQKFAQDDPVINAVLNPPATLGQLKISFESALPLIGVGGPASVFYPSVSNYIDTTVLIPEYSDVANAVGAAGSLVKVEVCIEVTLNELGGYFVHYLDEPISAESGPSAIAKATECAEKQLIDLVKQQGGKAREIKYKVDRIIVPDTENDAGLISAKITANCESMPT